MGIVYLAEENIPSRKVAVKRILPEKNHLQTLLIREAMITGELEHPNIIPIHRLELNGENAPQVVMKNIQGENLSSICEQNTRSIDWIQTTLPILVQVCHALEFAHSKQT